MYGRRSYGRSSRSGRSGRSYRRVTRPMRSTGSARKSLGLKSRNSASVNKMPNYLYRVVLNIKEDIVAISAGSLVTVDTVPSLDLL